MRARNVFTIGDYAGLDTQLVFTELWNYDGDRKTAWNTGSATS